MTATWLPLLTRLTAKSHSEPRTARSPTCSRHARRVVTATTTGAAPRPRRRPTPSSVTSARARGRSATAVSTKYRCANGTSERQHRESRDRQSRSSRSPPAHHRQRGHGGHRDQHVARLVHQRDHDAEAGEQVRDGAVIVVLGPVEPAREHAPSRPARLTSASSSAAGGSHAGHRGRTRPAGRPVAPSWSRPRRSRCAGSRGRGSPRSPRRTARSRRHGATSNTTTGRLATAATAVPPSATRLDPRANSRIARGSPNCGFSHATASAERRHPRITGARQHRPGRADRDQRVDLPDVQLRLADLARAPATRR